VLLEALRVELSVSEVPGICDSCSKELLYQELDVISAAVRMNEACDAVSLACNKHEEGLFREQRRAIGW
jgi:hypothetical protein